MPVDDIDSNNSELARAVADLACSRERFALSMGALEQKITRTFDWREWVRRRPGMTRPWPLPWGPFWDGGTETYTGSNEKIRHHFQGDET